MCPELCFSFFHLHPDNVWNFFFSFFFFFGGGCLSVTDSVMSNYIQLMYTQATTKQKFMNRVTVLLSKTDYKLLRVKKKNDEAVCCFFQTDTNHFKKNKRTKKHWIIIWCKIATTTTKVHQKQELFIHPCKWCYSFNRGNVSDNTLDNKAFCMKQITSHTHTCKRMHTHSMHLHTLICIHTCHT